MIRLTAKKYYWYILRVILMTPYEVKLLEDVLKNEELILELTGKQISNVLRRNNKGFNHTLWELLNKHKADIFKPACKYIRVKRLKAMIHSYKLFAK